MMTAKAPATRRLLLRATINVRASQLGGDSSMEGGSCQLSTTLSQGRVAPGKAEPVKDTTTCYHIMRYNMGSVTVPHIAMRINFENSNYVCIVFLSC